MAIALRESVIVGISDLWSRKIRTIVTMVGIILGTMSVIVVLSLMNGIQKKTMDWMMERGGLTKITISRNWDYQSPNNLPQYFTMREIKLIRSLIPKNVYMNPMKRVHAKLSYKDKTYFSSLRGIFPDYSVIEEWTVQEGRFINNNDIENANNVVVLGTKARDELFGEENALGKWITVQDKRLLVIGIMKYRFMENAGAVGNDNAFSYLNRRCYIPLTTMIYKGTGEDNINSFALKAESMESASDLRDKIEGIVLNLRRGEPIFEVESAKDEADKVRKNQMIFTMIFFLISAISMLVGGIVIMNIMLATIKERTREVGIRIAVGAKKNDIFVQFLVQTVIITMSGGVLGVVSGISILKFVGNFLNFEMIPNVFTIIIAITISVGIGMLSGIIPAIMASRLNPVEALRYE